MKLKVIPGQSHQSVFQPGEHGMKWLGLEVLRLEKGETWQGSYPDQEAALIILGGRCSIAVEAGQKATWQGLGSRGDVFSGLPAVVYAPRSSRIEVKADTKVEVAIGKAPCSVDLPPALVKPDEVKQVSSGMANWRRDVRLMIPPGSPLSQRLIVGETVNPPGNWSGFPPHKHDEIRPGENILEEFYLFKARPVDGFGLQPIYCEGQGEVHFVGNDDVTLMLNSYHPTVATPGTTLYYLWILSGDSKSYEITIDPTYRWVGNAEAILRELQH